MRAASISMSLALLGVERGAEKTCLLLHDHGSMERYEWCPVDAVDLFGCCERSSRGYFFDVCLYPVFSEDERVKLLGRVLCQIAAKFSGNENRQE
eukprot:IDg8671t1